MDLTQGDSAPPGDARQCLVLFFVVTGGGGVLLASRWQRPGIQLTSWGCTGQAPATENALGLNVNSPRVEKAGEASFSKPSARGLYGH